MDKEYMINAIPDNDENRKYCKLAEGLKEYAAERTMTQTLQALEFVRKRKNEGALSVPPLAMACDACKNIGIQEDDTIATILLQDMSENYGVALDDLPVTVEVRNSVALLSFCITDGESEANAKKHYYDKLLENRAAMFAKLMNILCNFPQEDASDYIEKAKEYVKETREYVIPMICNAKVMYPEASEALSYLETWITGVVNTMDLKLKILGGEFKLFRHL